MPDFSNGCFNVFLRLHSQSTFKTFESYSEACEYALSLCSDYPDYSLKDVFIEYFYTFTADKI